MNDSCNKDVEVLEANDLPIDGLESLPDYLVSVRSVYNSANGRNVQAFTRTPTKRLFTGAMANVVAIESNNSAISVEEHQVKAGYVQNTGTTNSVQYADRHHKPRFLILKTLAENMIAIQSSGFVVMPEGHDYIVGAQYYLGENGMPVTENQTGYTLFVPLSSTILKVDL